MDLIFTLMDMILVIWKLKKKNFYWHKSYVPLRDINIEKVLVSKKISFGEKIYKYFIGYLYNDHKVNPLHIMHPKTSAYVQNGQNKLTK